MIVYADVLIFLNTLVDYFLLLTTSKLTGETPKTFRAVLAAVLGGVSSLYIFLPQQKTVVEVGYKAAVAFLLSLVCYGFYSVKQYFKNTGVFFLVSSCYAGIMFALWVIFRPYGMVINNSVVYLNISPTILTAFSVVGYVVFTVFWQIFKKSAPTATRHEVTVLAEGRRITVNAIADTGNSLEDVFGKSEVIIADKKQVEALFGTTDIEAFPELSHRYRLLPCSTISGSDTLEAFRCDSAEIENNGRITTLKSPLLAVSKVPLTEDYTAIINPKILR